MSLPTERLRDTTLHIFFKTKRGEKVEGLSRTHCLCWNPCLGCTIQPTRARACTRLPGWWPRCHYDGSPRWAPKPNPALSGAFPREQGYGIEGPIGSGRSEGAPSCLYLLRWIAQLLNGLNSNRKLGMSTVMHIFSSLKFKQKGLSVEVYLIDSRKVLFTNWSNEGTDAIKHVEDT